MPLSFMVRKGLLQPDLPLPFIRAMPEHPFAVALQACFSWLGSGIRSCFTPTASLHIVPFNFPALL